MYAATDCMGMKGILMASGSMEQASATPSNSRSAWSGLGLLMVLLVLLRLSIGWHFLFEGLQKVYSTFTPKPFSASVYFRESAGPLSSTLRPMLPDPEKELSPKLTADGLQTRWRELAAPYIEGLSGEAKIQAEGIRDASQTEALEWLSGGNAAVRKSYLQALTLWNASGSSADQANVRKTRKGCIELIAEYQKRQVALATELAALAGLKPEAVVSVAKLPVSDSMDSAPLFQLDTATVGVIRSSALSAVRDHLTANPNAPDAKERWSRLDKAVKKADSWADQTQAWLTQGERSVDTPSPDGKDTGTLKQTLTTPERINRHAKLAKALEDQVASRRNWDFSKDVDKATLASAKAALAKSRTELNEDIDRMETDLTKKLQAMAADVSVTPRPWRLSDIFTIKTIDVMSILAITAIGAGLFTGTLTRLAALGGAAFLLLTYLAVPPFPWLPTPPLNEGNYVFINKNFVEMMALLVLAATPSGRWFGLDAVIMPLFFRDSQKA